MVQIRYIEHGGASHDVEVPAGVSLMEGALASGTPGIVGECGGQMACGTCHVFLEEPWLSVVGPPSAFEAGMLALSEHTQLGSRLACQIRASAALEGLTLRMPPSQP